MTVLPASLHADLQNHLTKVKHQHNRDLQEGFGRVYLPKALARKYPNAEREWGWQYVSPASRRSTDPRSGIECRHHLHPGTIQKTVITIQRFPTVGHFFSYARLVPGAHNSGGKHQHTRRKNGNRYLKMAFGQAAPKARQYYPGVRWWFERLEWKKGFPIANALLAKEIARGAYSVLLKDEPFHGKWKGQPLEHQKQRHWPRPIGAGSQPVNSSASRSLQQGTPRRIERPAGRPKDYLGYPERIGELPERKRPAASPDLCGTPGR